VNAFNLDNAKSSFSNLNAADKRKLIIAGGILVLAVVLLAWNFLGGAPAPSPEAQQAQEEVLQQMPDAVQKNQPEPVEEKLPEPLEIPAGRPRPVHPGG
jgi:hypothetical protein